MYIYYYYNITYIYILFIWDKPTEWGLAVGLTTYFRGFLGEHLHHGDHP